MSKLCPYKAAEEAVERNLQKPPSINGRYATMADSDNNHYGAMSEFSEPELHEFIEIASRSDAKVLEIAAAYGTPYLLEAFKSENTAQYTAVDLLGDQLRILARTIKEMFPEKLGSKLTLIEGAFPHKEMMDVLEGEYDAIMASSVFHFFTEEEVLQSFKECYRLLKPGGKLFARMGTLYSGRIHPDLKEKMGTEIKNFIEHRTRPVPGFVLNIREVVSNPSDIKTMNETSLTQKHKFLFDKDVTEIIVESEGFKIEHCDYISMDMFPWKCDGRERLLLIARKPH